jgi:hypothetical protein
VTVSDDSLARALQQAGLTYTSTEHTEAELAVWRRTAVALRDLEHAFDGEGNRRMWSDRQSETDHVLEVCEKGQSRRFLYVATCG